VCVWRHAPSAHVFPSPFSLLSPHHFPFKSGVTALGLAAVSDCLWGGHHKFSLDFGILKLSWPLSPSPINQGSPVPAWSAKGKRILFLGLLIFLSLGFEQADHARAKAGVLIFSFALLQHFSLIIHILFLSAVFGCMLFSQIYICFYYYLLLIFFVWFVPLPLHCVCLFYWSTAFLRDSS
jgi:hypothetical protein